MTLPNHSQPPMLDYATPPVPLRRRMVQWFSYPGPDTFVGCSALLFAILAVMTLVALPWEPAMSFLGWPLCVVASAFAIGGLFERETSKTFPLTALGLVVLYALVMSLAFT